MGKLNLDCACSVFVTSVVQYLGLTHSIFNQSPKFSFGKTLNVGVAVVVEKTGELFIFV